jgi:hypothetical protein
MAHPNDRPHNNNTGRFEPTQDTADRAAQAARLRKQHPQMTYQQIADAVGYSDRGNAWRAIQRCREAVIRQAGAELVESESQQLDDLYVMALEIIERNHVVVSHGRVITMPDPETGEEKPLLDDGPRLQAINTALRIRDQYQNLHGAKQPAKVEHSGGVTYTVVGVDPKDLV